MTITYPPGMLPGRPDEDGAQVIVCCGADCCKAENERLRAALEFYAHAPVPKLAEGYPYCDDGRIARAALAYQQSGSKE